MPATSVFSFAMYISSLTISDLSKIGLWSKIFIIAVSVIHIVLIIYAIFTSRYSIDVFYRDITSCTDDNNFSLLLIKDSDGRYLLKQDKRWKTYLFPYTRTKENDSESIKTFAKESLGIDIQVLKTAESNFTKRSISANMTKTYHHTFYLCSIKTPLPQQDSLKIKGTKYKWFSFDKMKQNKNVWLKNYENFEFVEKNF